jgi:hypothetical protein
MEYVIDNQIPGDLTIHSDNQAAISRVGHTGTGPGQDRALRVVQAVQRRLRHGWRTRIEWVPGHSGIVGNERADQLAGEAASERRHGRTSIAWLNERISQHFTIAKDSETDKGKETITRPAPKTSFLDLASNRLARTIAQILTGHWLCTPYLKRVRKNREEQVSDKCWWCGQYRMSRTHVFLKCTQRFLGPPRRRWQDKKTSNFCRPALREIKVGKAIGRLDNGNRCWFGWSG